MPNAESVDNTTNPHLKYHCYLYVEEHETYFVLIKHKFSLCFSIHAFTENFKNMKNSASEIFKHSIPGKLDTEEAPHIEACENPNTQDNCNLTPQNAPVDYADMLLPLTKICRVKLNDVLSEIGIVEKYKGIT